MRIDLLHKSPVELRLHFLALLTKLIVYKEGHVANFEKLLANPGYVNNAKPELVAETREMLVSVQADVEAARSALAALG